MNPEESKRRLVVDSLEPFPPIDEIDPQDHELYRREEKLHARLLKIFGDPEVRVCHDFWGNIGGVRTSETLTNAREPTVDCRTILGLEDKVERNEFITACQIVPHISLCDYLVNLGREFGVEPTEEMQERFRKIVQTEQDLLYAFTEAKKKLHRLAKRHHQGLITNTPWTTTLLKFLQDQDLFDVFDPEGIVVSSVELVAKQHGTPIYQVAALRLKTKPQKMVMIGDNLLFDIIYALEFGMMVILNDRERKYVDIDGNWRKLATLNEGGTWCKAKGLDTMEHMTVRFVDQSGAEREATVADLSAEELARCTYGDLLVKHVAEDGTRLESYLADLDIPVIRSYDPIPAPQE